MAFLDPNIDIGMSVEIDVRGRPVAGQVVGSAVCKEGKVMDFIPHTDAEIDSMLSFIGVQSLDHLFDMVPVRIASGWRA